MSTLDSLRALVRDTDSVVFQDADLQAALDVVGGTDLLRAAGVAVQTLAIEYAQQGKSVTTADLSVDLADRGPNLVKVAQSFFAQAAAIAEAGADSFIAVAEPGGRTPGWDGEVFWAPYGSPYYFGTEWIV